MTGHWLRLNRLFTEGKRAIIVAVDHGEFLGPIQGMVDLPSAVGPLTAADAVLLSPGMMGHCGSLFDHRGAPLAVIRLDWNTALCEQWGYQRARVAQVVTPADALAMGGDLCLASLALGGSDEERDTAGVDQFARFARLKQECGLPLVGEYCPPNAGRLNPEDLHQRVLVGCRLLAELGADAIKTYYTGEAFQEVVEATPVPVITQVAERLATPLEVLSFAQKAASGGARGVVLGRPVMQAEYPDLLLRALARVVKEDANPEEVAAEFGLA